VAEVIPLTLLLALTLACVTIFSLRGARKEMLTFTCYPLQIKSGTEQRVAGEDPAERAANEAAMALKMRSEEEKRQNELVPPPAQREDPRAYQDALRAQIKVAAVGGKIRKEWTCGLCTANNNPEVRGFNTKSINILIDVNVLKVNECSTCGRKNPEAQNRALTHDEKVKEEEAPIIQDPSP